MRFRTKQRPKGLLTRRHQLHLTMMLIALGIVLIGSRIVGKPEFWATAFPAVAAEQTAISRTALRPDYSGDEPKRLPEELRDVIRDNVIGVTAEEWRAWGVSLSYAEELQKQNKKETPVDLRTAKYALLMGAPDHCRGRPWTVTGALRRMTRETTHHSKLGPIKVVDAWLTLPDSGDGLVHVISRSANGDLEFLDDYGKDPPQVTLTGYFFKREAYASQAETGLSIAPLFLADSISEVPQPAATARRSDQLTPWLSWLALGVCGAIVVVVWSFMLSDAAHKRQRTHALTRLPPSPSFDGVDAESPREMLQHMEVATDSGSTPSAHD